jgi:hypothetical protein
VLEGRRPRHANFPGGSPEGWTARHAACNSAALGRPEQLRSRRCECGAADCTAVVQMLWEEQDAVDHNDHWVVAPGHQPRGGRSWRIVSATDRFAVVAIEEERDE